MLFYHDPIECRMKKVCQNITKQDKFGKWIMISFPILVYTYSSLHYMDATELGVHIIFFKVSNIPFLVATTLYSAISKRVVS